MFEANMIGIPRDSKGSPFSVPRLLHSDLSDLPGVPERMKEEMAGFVRQYTTNPRVLEDQWCVMLHDCHARRAAYGKHQE